MTGIHGKPILCVICMFEEFQYNDVLAIGNSCLLEYVRVIGTTPPHIPIPKIFKHNNNESKTNTKAIS